MKYFDFEYNTPTVIYGAGLRGQLFYHNLQKSGFTNIRIFLDKNAANICPILGIEVLSPSSEDISHQMKADGIIVISVTNVFEHEKIAKELHSLGFENIIFKSLSGASVSPEKRIVNNIFDSILDMKYYQTKLKPIKHVPKYNTLTHESDRPNSILRIINEDYLVAAVPVELIFSLSNETKLTPYKTEELEKKFGLTHLFDAPFFAVSQQISLFDYFETGNQTELEKYINVIRFNYELIGKAITISEIDRIISSRHQVYCEMNNLMSIKNQFFSENPVKLKWNQKGYFNILDGKHRLALFIAKGLRKIPSKMTSEDFNKWINKPTLGEINSLDITRKFVYLLHPVFQNTCSLSYFHSQCLFSLIKFIINKVYDYRGLSALCVGIDSTYYFQYFFKMGMRARQAITEGGDLEKARFFNKLCYLGEELVFPFSCFQDIHQDKRYDIAVVLMFGPNSIRCNFQTFFEQIAPIIDRYYIVMCQSQDKDKIVSELRKFHFNYVNQLCRVHTEEGPLDSVLFCRNI
jgi:hypothetical protein